MYFLLDNLYPEKLCTIFLWNTGNPKHEIFFCETCLVKLSYTQAGYKTLANNVNAKCQYSYHHWGFQSQCWEGRK